MNKNSQTIKTAFILSIVGNGLGDLIILFYLYLAARLGSWSGNLSALGLLYIIIICTLIFAPLVFGIISLNMIKGVNPVTQQDRVFRIITKIFSIVNIVGGAIVAGYVVIAVFIVGMLVNILSGQEALIVLLLAF